MSEDAPVPSMSSLPVSTPAFDMYWQFAAARQRIYFARVNGEQPPWTDDPVLVQYRFTNPYRATDRVSQFLIRSVIYDGDHDEYDLVFRILLFKIFNRIETWRLLESHFGAITCRDFDVDRYAAVLDAAMQAGARIYSAAYIMPPASHGALRKHHSHLALLAAMLDDNAPKALVAARSLKTVYEILSGYRGIGSFLAFQYAIDLNYAPMMDHSEMEFVQPGPGALDGLRKCFPSVSTKDAPAIIRAVCEGQDEHFAARGLSFQSLWGRPLQLIDCQNLFCETSKYTRVTHPDIRGSSSRTRIKQRFIPAGPLPSPAFPPKWRLQVSAEGRPWPGGLVASTQPLV